MYFHFQNLFFFQFLKHDNHISFFLFCKFSFAILLVNEPIHPCNPSPCGSNAICMEKNGAGSCTCITGFHGDPYVRCRPECIQNNDCSSDKACLGMKCRDPCLGSCGLNAQCRVINHIPDCFCISGFTGNANILCKKIEPSMQFD